MDPLSAIFAWTAGLNHRAIIDLNEDLSVFCRLLEKAAVKTAESGYLTKELTHFSTSKEDQLCTA